MVATNPSEDTKLPTTRLQMISIPCLGLILQCPSFLHIHSLLWFMFPFTDNHHPYTLLRLHPWCGRLPLCWPRLFLIVLSCITNLLFPWHHTPFVLDYSSFTWSCVLLTDHSHTPSCLCFSFGPDYSEVLIHTDSIVVQIPDVIYDVMTTPVYKISKCGRVTPQLWYLGKSSALLCLCVIKDKSELNE